MLSGGSYITGQGFDAQIMSHRNDRWQDAATVGVFINVIGKRWADNREVNAAFLNNLNAVRTAAETVKRDTAS